MSTVMLAEIHALMTEIAGVPEGELPLDFQQRFTTLALRTHKKAVAFLDGLRDQIQDAVLWGDYELAEQKYVVLADALMGEAVLRELLDCHMERLEQMTPEADTTATIDALWARVKAHKQ
jgi:hypothetical protein